MDLLEKAVLIFGTLDTKLVPYQHLRSELETFGLKTMLMDTSLRADDRLGQENIDLPRSFMLRAAGISEAEFEYTRDRGKRMELAAYCVKCAVEKLYAEDRICGAISMGGGQGAHLAAAGMAALPVGFPKVILSTVVNSALAAGYLENVADTVMINSLVDIEGENRLLHGSISRAAAAMFGLLQQRKTEHRHGRKTVGMSMFGITTPCVSRVEHNLQAAGYEVVVFHATGLGGRIFEKLIADGQIDAALDVTLAELSAELLGYDGSAGPERLTAAAKKGIPLVVVPGALDVLTFAPAESMPEKLKDRPFIMHSADVKVVRTSPEECSALGRQIRDRLSQARGSVLLALPLRGISENDRPGLPLYDRQADEALFAQLRAGKSEHIELLELDAHINDPAFADQLSAWLLRELEKGNVPCSSKVEI